MNGDSSRALSIAGLFPIPASVSLDFPPLLFTLWTDKLLAYIFNTKGMIVLSLHPVFVSISLSSFSCFLVVTAGHRLNLALLHSYHHSTRRDALHRSNITGQSRHLPSILGGVNDHEGTKSLLGEQNWNLTGSGNNEIVVRYTFFNIFP
jgi:hypothetical protein